MDKQAEIIGLREKLQRDYGERNIRIQAYYDMRDLKDPRAGEAKAHGVSNIPKTGLNLAIHFLSSAPEKIRIIEGPSTIAERKTLSRAERFLFGVALVNDFESWKGGGPISWIREGADLLTTEGSLYTLSLVMPDADGSPLFIAENWAAKDCYPVTGWRGLKAFIHYYEISPDEALEKAELMGWKLELPKAQEAVKITDYYERRIVGSKPQVLHAILADDKIVQSLDFAGGTEGLFKEIPVRGGGVGYADRGRQSWRLHAGEGFLESIREVNENFNTVYTYLLRAVQKGIQVILAETGPGEVKQVGKVLGKLQEYEDVAVPLPEGHALASLALSQGVPEAAAVLQTMSAMEQRGTLSYALSGQLPAVEMAGYLYSQLIASALANLGPFRTFLNLHRAQICRDWILGYRDGPYGAKPIKLAGNYNNRYDGYFYEEVSQKDMPNGYFWVEVKTPLALPSNILQQLSAMSMAAPGQQLASLSWLWDNVLEIESTELMREQIEEDMARKAMTPIHLSLAAEKIADGLEQEGNPRHAKLAHQFAEMLLGQKEQPPPKAPGVRPELGGLEMEAPSEDQMRAAMGMGPVPIRRPARGRLAGAGLDMGRRRELGA